MSGGMPLSLDWAPSLVDAIEEALDQCLNENGQDFKLLVAQLQNPRGVHWAQVPKSSNIRTIATWVAMALHDRHRDEQAEVAGAGGGLNVPSNSTDSPTPTPTWDVTIGGRTLRHDNEACCQRHLRSRTQIPFCTPGCPCACHVSGYIAGPSEGTDDHG